MGGKGLKREGERARRTTRHERKPKLKAWMGVYVCMYIYSATEFIARKMYTFSSISAHTIPKRWKYSNSATECIYIYICIYIYACAYVNFRKLGVDRHAERRPPGRRVVEQLN